MKIIIQEIDNVSPPCEPPSHQVPPTTTKEFSNTVEDETEPGEEDEFDLYPDVLELPPLRSPRGSINSIYGSSRNGSRHGSRHGSNCSQVHLQLIKTFLQKQPKKNSFTFTAHFYAIQTVIGQNLMILTDRTKRQSKVIMSKKMNKKLQTSKQLLHIKTITYLTNCFQTR